MTSRTISLPREFIVSRLHSLFGLMIVLFLIEHLLTNSQVALFLGDNGAGFVRGVNFIHNLPYLPVIEIVLIGIPIAFHAIAGIRIAIRGRSTSYNSSGGTRPKIQTGRNRAYTWQRLSSWILLIGIILHVGYMRFYLYPAIVLQGGKKVYFTRVEFDRAQYALSDRLGFTIYNVEAIEAAQRALEQQEMQLETIKTREAELEEQQKMGINYQQELQELVRHKIDLQDKRAFLENGLRYRSINLNQVILVTDSFGTSQLMNVREAFKSPVKVALYTLFVLAAVFHGFNGLWTFLITWGLVIKSVSQRKALTVCWCLMGLVGLLGLISIFGTYLDYLRS